MAFKSPAEVVEVMGGACAVKTGLPWPKLLVSGFLAGAYIGLGGLLAIMLGKGIAPVLVAFFVGVVSWWLYRRPARQGQT